MLVLTFEQFITRSTSLSQIFATLTLPNPEWNDCSPQPLTSIRIYKIGNQPSSSHQPQVVTHSILVKHDLSWEVYIHGHKIVPGKCAALTSVPSTLCPASFSSLLHLVDTLNVCAAHPDPHFIELANSRKGKLYARDGNIAAEVDTYCSVELDGVTYEKCVRTTRCELLTGGARCSTCAQYRPTLQAIYHRWFKQ